MAIVKKQIKFDLPIDGVKVKTVDELTDHLTVELVEHLKSGLLAKWLLVREPELAENIQQIKVTDKSDRELLIAILEGLGFEADEQIIDAMFMVHEQVHAKLTDAASTINENVSDQDNPQEVTTLERIEFHEGEIFKGKIFRNIDFSNEILNNFDFSQCEFINCKFDNTMCKN